MVTMVSGGETHQTSWLTCQLLKSSQISFPSACVVLLLDGCVALLEFVSFVSFVSFLKKVPCRFHGC